MRIEKIDGRLAIAIPEDVIAGLGLAEGDEIAVTLDGESEFDFDRMRKRREALARIRAMRVPLPPGYTFNREELYERGDD